MGHEHSPADIYPTLLKAFNAGDVDATVACYESKACFVLKSGHVACGAVELREMFHASFSQKPDLKLDVSKIIPAGDNLALVIVKWTSKTVSSSGETKVRAGTATDIARRQPDGTWKLVFDNPYGIELKANAHPNQV
jgi:uncharacterized protein (TIGR02246 family)